MENNINYKFYLFKRILREKGILFSIMKLILFLLRPSTYLLKRNILLLNFFYGSLPNLRQKIFPINSGLIKFTESELVEKVRYFWYSNASGSFDLEGEKISRKDIFIYGGPNPKLTCAVCQKSEWLSRIRQKNLFIRHACPQSKECEILCSRQGDELWTNLHQNFDFSLGCDLRLPVPKCLCIIPDAKYAVGSGSYRRFQNPGCDQLGLVLRRRLAYACQVDVVRHPVKINWHKYDFVFTPNLGYNRKFQRPPLPIIIYGHDFWPLEDKGYQWMIDWLKPDILLTPYPSQWKEYFKIPRQTEIVFYPFFDSLFFTRPNLNNKKIDLLAIGALTSPVYKKRIPLTKQIMQLKNKYNIEFSHSVGVFSAEWPGPVAYIDEISRSQVCYLNKWSEYLGSAKYVIFGEMQFPILVSKYYEILGSGAVPIFPEVPDLKLLGLKPFEHYIPLSEAAGNNEKLSHYLDNYDKHKQIAENALKWYKKVSDKMIFEDFESLIGKITNNKYSKRLIL